MSVSSTGVQATAESRDPAMTPDGRFIAFESLAGELVPGDTNGYKDIFIRDTQTGVTERVSVATGSPGAQANAGSWNPSISADGRYVVFESLATNLVASDTNVVRDIFVRDRVTNETKRLSVATGTPGAQANAASQNAVISADGRYVTFDSSATNLVSGDSNLVNDVFVRDLQTNSTTRVSVTNAGAQATGGGSRNPSISADGRYVAFESNATNLVTGDTNAKTDIFVRDRTGNTTVRVSVRSGGTQTTTGASVNPVISGDGAIVAFESSATDLVGGDTNGAVDIFARGRTGSPATHRVSVASGGTQANNSSSSPSISSDGRYVSFDSAATNLVGGDTNGKDDVFVRDRTGSTTTRVNLSSSGAQGDGHSRHSSVSVVGVEMIVAFDSLATNLVPGDTNGTMDVFVSVRRPVPTITSLGSSTHPVSTTWYPSPTPRFEWTGVDAGTGISGYSVSLSQDAGALPNDTVNTTNPYWQSGSVANGVWYFTVKARSSEGTWGPVAGPLAVRVDATVPTGTVIINGGADFTGTTQVTVGTSATFGPSGAHPSGAMRFSTDGGATWGSWVAYASSYPVTLPAGDGSKSVRAQFRNAAGTVSTATISDTIVLDTAGPALSGLASSTHPSPDVWYASNGPVTFTWTQSTDPAGVTGYSTSWSTDPAAVPNDTVDVSPATTTSKSYPAPVANGEWYFAIKARDTLGNWGAPVSRRVRIDATVPTGTIVLGGGADYTGSQLVSVTSSAAFGPSGPHATGAMRFSTDGGTTWGAWTPYSVESEVTLPAGDGLKTVRAQFRNAAGTVSTAVISDEITLSSDAPVITGLTSPSHGTAGAWSSEPEVDLAWGANTEVAGYSYTWSQNPAVAPDETVDGTAGTLTRNAVPGGEWYFKVRAKGSGGIWGASSALTVRVDTAVPTGTLTIDDGAPYTTSPTVSVALDATFGESGPHPTEAMRLSADGGTTWGAWTPFGAESEVTLPEGDGTKTVRAQLRNAAGTVSSAIIQDTIVLSSDVPFGTLTIDDGAPYTTSPTVSVATDVAFGPSGPHPTEAMRLSADGGTSYGEWSAYSTPVTLTLPEGDGSKSVHAQFRNAAGTLSTATISDSIVLDTAAPLVFGLDSPTHGDSGTPSDRRDVEFDWDATATSGIAGYSYTFSQDPGAVPDQTVDTSEGTAAFSDVTDGEWHFAVRARNGAGVWGDPATLVVRIQGPAGPGTTEYVQVAGESRYDTAVEASKQAFPGGSASVVIATGARWPDALGGSALAGVLEAPLLLTRPTALPDAARSEIGRLKATRAYLLGGTAAVSADVEADLKEMLGADNVIRVAGESRYETAQKIAERVIAIQGEAYSGKAFVATGRNFPDALGASPLATAAGQPIILAARDEVPTVHGSVREAVILGGPAAVSEVTEAGLAGSLGADNVTRIGGESRYETAALVAEHTAEAGAGWDSVGIATGQAFPDALAGGAMLGHLDAVLLLTRPTLLVPEAEARLAANSSVIDTVYFVGGPAAVGQEVRDEIVQLLQ